MIDSVHCLFVVLQQAAAQLLLSANERLQDLKLLPFFSNNGDTCNLILLSVCVYGRDI